MKYVFHPEALAEYAAAVQYYAENRAEVAQAFINAVEDAISGKNARKRNLQMFEILCRISWKLSVLIFIH
jgi:plasmid stabilization system protein ParE